LQELELIKTLNLTPIRIDEVKNSDDIEGEDFEPLDIIEIDVKIKNTHDDDKIKTVTEVVLIHEDGKVDDTDEDINVKIDDDDTETVTLKIEIPADIEEGVHYLYVKVTNDEDENNCDQKYYKFDIEKSSREIIPVDEDFPKIINCGEQFEFSGKVVNIGEKDEEKVKVAYKAFGELFEEIYDDMDEGDYSSLFTFTQTLPTDFKGVKKTVMNIFYDFDDDDNTFDESESFTYTIQVNCEEDDLELQTETSLATLGLESDVRVLVKNPSFSSKVYTLSASADWGTVKSISPSSLTLASGGQQYVTVKVEPNENVTAGTYNLDFKASFDSKTESLKVPVSVQEDPSKGSNVFNKIGSCYKDNTSWAAINTILVLAIIAVVVLIFTGKNKIRFSGFGKAIKSVHR